MLDPFLILTPVLLLAIVALLGFVGCYQAVTLTPQVTHVQTVVQPAPCLLYTSPSPRDYAASRMPSSA